MSQHMPEPVSGYTQDKCQNTYQEHISEHTPAVMIDDVPGHSPDLTSEQVSEHCQWTRLCGIVYQYMNSCALLRVGIIGFLNLFFFMFSLSTSSICALHCTMWLGRVRWNAASRRGHRKPCAMRVFSIVGTNAKCADKNLAIGLLICHSLLPNMAIHPALPVTCRSTRPPPRASRSEASLPAETGLVRVRRQAKIGSPFWEPHASKGAMPTLAVPSSPKVAELWAVGWTSGWIEVGEI